LAGILKVDQVQSDSNLSFNLAGSNVAYLNATSLQLVSSNISLAGTNVFTSGKLVTSAQPTGAVLQVVQYNYTGATTISSGSYVSTPITANITPSSTSSKILVRVVVHCGMTGSNEGLHGQLWRNGSVVTGALGAASASRDQAWFHSGAHYTAYEQYAAAAEYLDSPASTSTQTYTVYGRGNSSGYPININTTENDQDSGTTSRTVSTITLMEIAG